ncbi:MAG: PAS domain S-box protein [Chloroflexota bacterium]
MQPKAKILIVDDDPFVLYANQRLLEAAGYEILLATTGAEALQQARHNKPDLLLLDVNLPDISGLEVNKQIKVDTELTNVFVVLLSGINTDSESQALGLESGADGYITLPIAHREFLARIDAMLRIRRVEQELRASEARYRLLAENVSDVIWVIDTQTLRFRYISPSVERMRGFTVEEVIAQDVFAALTPDSYNRLKEIIPQRVAEFQNGVLRTHIDEIEQPCKDGSSVWTETSTRFVINPENSHLEVYGISRDISERKRAKSELEERNSILNSVLENTDEPIFALDHHYCYIGFNQAHARMMKSFYDAEILIGGCMAEYHIPSATWTMIKENLDRALQGETVTALDFSGSGEKRRDYEVLHNPIYRPSGEIFGVSIFIRDITERRRIEQTLQEYSARLEAEVEERTHELRAAQERLVLQERLAALGQLAGGVSHELRNPLGVISNAHHVLGLLLPQAESKVKEYLDIIGYEVRSADKIIHDLLDFSHIQSADRQPVDSAQLVQQAMRRHPVPANINLSLSLPDDLPLLFADPQHVEMILTNLILNACQAMPSGGGLTIRVETIDGRKQVAIHVIDTGQGISPENLHKLFQPFFTTKSKGIGLGLVVCQKLAEVNDGQIQVLSEPGKGSTFTIQLKAAP